MPGATAATAASAASLRPSAWPPPPPLTTLPRPRRRCSGLLEQTHLTMPQLCQERPVPVYVSGCLAGRRWTGRLVGGWKLHYKPAGQLKIWRLVLVLLIPIHIDCPATCRYFAFASHLFCPYTNTPRNAYKSLCIYLDHILLRDVFSVPAVKNGAQILTNLQSPIYSQVTDDTRTGRQLFASRRPFDLSVI